MVEAVIMDLTTVCHSFPRVTSPQIARGNFLDAIETIFEGDTEVVVIEGAEGIGKTTLLAQFARRHPNHALSLFAKPTSRWAYDPAILQFDLCNQLQWALLEEELASAEGADDAFLRTRVLALERRARCNRELFYFVVDGLDEIPEEDRQIRGLIVDMLPLGLPGFRFLFAGDATHLSAEIHRGVSVKPFVLSGFTPDESLRYLDDLNIDSQLVEEIHQTCKGIPGHLASLRRILVQSDINVRTLVEEMPEKLPGLFEIEWRKVKADDDVQLTMLAILAHDRRAHTLDDLARILEVQTTTLRNLLQDLGFVTLDTQSGQITFVSETFRRFARSQLGNRKKDVHDLLISDLLRVPDSEASMTHLPAYFQEAGRLEDLLEYLSPDHFTRIVEISQSLSPVQQKAELGVDAALRLHRDGDLMRFGLQSSVVTELGAAEVWQSEIKARMALDDYDSAVALAQSAVLREDRLGLLAAIGRKKHEQGLSLEAELLDQIRHLCEQIDPLGLGERAVDIASDLICCDFDLAIDLIEKATSSDPSVDENALDWAFAKFSIAALFANREQPERIDSIDSIRTRIKDPAVRRFSAAASLLLGEYSAREVMARTEKLESVSDRLYLLGQWAIQNREREDAAQIVDFALDLAIRTTEYAPNARVFREIATPLPFIDEESSLKRLVGRFDSQKGSIERLGPTEDYLRLELSLAQAEMEYDSDAARNRLVDIYLQIADLDDLVVKTGCMARLASSLADMDPGKTLEMKEGLHALARDDLDSCVKRLLHGTAEHYHACRGIVTALAKAMPETALDVAMALNTEARRDLALLELVQSVVEMPVSKIDLAFVVSVLDKLADPDLTDEALLKVIERLFLATEDLGPLLSGALPLINRIGDIQDAGERCRACCLAYNVLMKHAAGEHSGLASHLLHELSDAWQAMDVGWHKVDTGFRIAHSLALSSLEMGRTHLELASQLREEVSLETDRAAWTYLACLRLAIRAYGGLLPSSLETGEDMTSLAELISLIPSSGKRAELWAELALRNYLNERFPECANIVGQHVRPLLQLISDKDARYRNEAVVKAAPALYCAHKATALDLISKLPGGKRDRAYAAICTFLLRKKPLSDPYEEVSGKSFPDLTYEEIVDICELLDLIGHDTTVYYFIKCIADSVVARRGERFSRQQKSDIASRLSSVIDSKLPNYRHIKHDGYKIAAQAQVARIQGARGQPWTDLIDSARAIPNIADRALVLPIVAVSLPPRQQAARKEALEEAEEMIREIPSSLDRAERYRELASMVVDSYAATSRRCLEIAMQSAIGSNAPELRPVQRTIVDAAYRLDPALAASLASLADDDPARAEIGSSLKQRIRILDLRKAVSDRSMPSLDWASGSRQDCARAAWMLLGALNAGLVDTVHPDQVRSVLPIAASAPLGESYPIFAWAIENLTQRFARTPQAGTYLRPLFEATLLGLELAGRMATRSSDQSERARRHAIGPSARSSLLVKPGGREEAIQFLTNWMANEVRDYLKICDPFFGPDDLEAVRLLCSVNPACKVQILTSRHHQDNERIAQPWGETYRTHWRVRISIQDPPNTEVVIAGTESAGMLPIHDRWWLTRGAGIRIENSFSALGLDRTSGISVLSQQEADLREKEVDQYLDRVKREHNGERILYELITL